MKFTPKVDQRLDNLILKFQFDTSTPRVRNIHSFIQLQRLNSIKIRNKFNRWLDFDQIHKPTRSDCANSDDNVSVGKISYRKALDNVLERRLMTRFRWHVRSASAESREQKTKSRENEQLTHYSNASFRLNASVTKTTAKAAEMNADEDFCSRERQAR